MRTLNDVVDPGAGPNLVLQDMLPVGWRQDLDTQLPLPKLFDTNGRPLKLLDAIRLKLHLGNIHFQFLFFVAPSLAAPLIICTSFLDSTVKAIRFDSWKGWLTRLAVLYGSSAGTNPR